MALTKVTESIIDFDTLKVGTTATGGGGLVLSESINLTFSSDTTNSYANLFRQKSSAATVLAQGYKYSDTSNAFASSIGSSWAKTAISQNYGTIRFYTDAAATTAVGTDVTPTERMRINSSGYVGMGSTGDTTHRLTLTAEQTTGKRCLLVHSINAGLACVVKNTSGTGAYDPFAFLIDGGNTQVGGIASGAGGTSFNTSSDYRLKENVDYTWDATTRLKQLRPARFNWISDDTDTLVDGFLAHEVEDIVPEAITGTKDATKTHTNVVREAGGYILEEGVTEDDWIQGKEDGIYESDTTWTASLTKDVYQQIDQAKLVPLLVKTIQELEARITTLENA